MKITKTQLKQIIREEVTAALKNLNRLDEMERDGWTYVVVQGIGDEDASMLRQQSEQGYGTEFDEDGDALDVYANYHPTRRLMVVKFKDEDSANDFIARNKKEYGAERALGPEVPKGMV